MPRQKAKQTTPLEAAAQRVLWDLTGQLYTQTVADLDPKPEPFVKAILAIMETGAALFMRPTSDGYAIAIAIWEGDVRHKATLCHETEQVDLWAEEVIQRTKLNKARE